MSVKIAIGGINMAGMTEKRKNWKKTALYRYEINFHRDIDKEVLDFFEKIPNKRQYLISLIKKDMEEKKSAS